MTARRNRELDEITHWACSDGRTALGVIDLVDGAYVTSVDGVITGTFRTRLEAARSFPDSISTDSGRRKRPLASTPRIFRSAEETVLWTKT
jgi:hypothetical protein